MKSVIASGLLGLTSAASPLIAASTYFEVFTEAEAAGGIAGAFLDAVASDGDNVFTFSRAQAPSVDESNISRFDPDTGTFTPLVDTPAWNAARTGTFEVVGSNGARVTTAGDLRFINFFDNSYYSVNTATGDVSVVTPSSAFDEFIGGQARIVAAYEALADGSALVYETSGSTDSILAVSSSGVISTAISNFDLVSAAGGTSIGGIGFDGSSILVGSNSNDSLLAFSNGISSVVLDTATIESLTDDIDGRVGFGDIFYAPDGRVYFYESDSDYIMSYDPANPSESLSVVISESELGEGPGSDIVGQLSWYQGNLSWTDQSDGFFRIPEPSTAGLLLISVPLLIRRRRA